MEMTLNETIQQNKNQMNIDKINYLTDKYELSSKNKN